MPGCGEKGKLQGWIWGRVLLSCSQEYPGKPEIPGKVCLAGGIPGGAHPSQICWSWSGGAKSSVPGEGGGKATFILAGERLLFQTCLGTGSSLFQPWPPAKFLSSFLQESRRKRAGLLPPAPDIPPAINPGEAFGCLVPGAGVWELLGGGWDGAHPSRCALLGSSWALGGTGGSLEVTFRAGLDSWPERFEPKVEESREFSSVSE